MAEHSEYGYLFRAAKAMCDVLAIKYDIGVRTRSAYLSRDLDWIRELTGEYEELENRINTFYGHYRIQHFMKTNSLALR